MLYLIVKILSLLCLSALLGAIFGSWWTRRKFIDVTEEHSRLTSMSFDADLSDDFAAIQLKINKLEDGMDKKIGNMSKNMAMLISDIPHSFPKQKPATDVGPLERKVAQLQTAINNIPQPVIPEFNLSPINSRIQHLEDAVNSIPRPAKHVPVDLDPIITRIRQLENAVRSIPEPKMPRSVDLNPLISKVEKIESLVKSLPKPSVPKPVDLGPVKNKIARLESLLKSMPKPVTKKLDLTGLNSKITKLNTAIHSIPKTKTNLDFSGINTKIKKLETLVRSIPKPKETKIDLNGVNTKISKLTSAINAMPKPKSAKAVNLTPLESRIGRLEKLLRGIEKSFSKVTRVKRVEKNTPSKHARKKQVVVQKRAKGPKMLKTASFGKKDDLKKIHGIGPKLEKLLNKLGVYYFWQISDWTKRDISFVDEKLDVFQGRIERDSWVLQAKSLARLNGAAKASNNVSSLPAAY